MKTIRTINRLRAPPAILDCGGKRSATPLWNGPDKLTGHAKALSPLRFASAVQMIVVSILGLCSHVLAEETNAVAPVTARDFYNAGTELLTAKKYDGAEQMFQSALAAQDERVQPAALYNLGHARFDDGAELLKKGPDAQKTAARGNAVSAAGGDAIDSAQSALDGKDVSKMMAAYLKGRGVRRNLRDVEKAVRDAMGTYGNALRKWRRAADDFKSAAELNPTDTNAVRNAQIVGQHIAKLVDSLQQMQQMAAAMAGQHQQMNSLLSQLAGRIPRENMPPGAGGGDDDEEVQPGSLAGQKEGASREGDQMQMPLSPDQARQLLDGLSLDGSRRLQMSDQQGAPSKERKGRDW
jgi:tetratricopeptide (TPR) repeat protein